MGEQLRQQQVDASRLGLTTATAANVTATPLTLTPGVWMIFGFIYFVGTATSVTQLVAGVSSTSATLPNVDSPRFLDNTTRNLGGNGYQIGVPATTVNIATTTSYYLIARATFTGGTVEVAGQFQAIRIA